MSRKAMSQLDQNPMMLKSTNKYHYSARAVKELAKRTVYDKTRTARRKAFNQQEASRKRNRK